MGRKESNQTIWGFAGRTYHIVGNFISRLNTVAGNVQNILYTLLRYWFNTGRPVPTLQKRVDWDVKNLTKHIFLHFTRLYRGAQW